MNPSRPSSAVQPPPMRSSASLSDDDQVVYPPAATPVRRSVFGSTSEPAPARTRAVEPARPAPAGTRERVEQAQAAPRVVPPAPLSEPDPLPDAYSDIPAYRLRANDPVLIELRGIPNSEKFELKVDERGYISLPFIDPIPAAGRNSFELQRDIQRAYIDNQIYKQVTPIVVIPAQSYFIRGEVRQPGRYPVITGLKLLQAVAAAGGYTEYANSRRISVIRDDKTREYNAREFERYPTRDIDIMPGDVIVVPRSVW